MIKLFVCVIAFLCMGVESAFADIDTKLPTTNIDKEKLRKKSVDSFDAAESSARSGHGVRMPEIKTPKVGVDVNQIAERYKNSLAKVNSDSDGLLIFVSLSMPEAALINIGKQAKAAHAVLVMRGVNGGLGSNWSLAMKALEPISATGASIIIHPEYFKKYKIQQVPSFVLRSSQSIDTCSDDNECSSYLKSDGDVSLDYVLERWSNGKGELAKKAKKHLDMLGDGL